MMMIFKRGGDLWTIKRWFGMAHEWQSSGRVGGIRYSPKAQQKEKMKAPNMKTSNYDNNTSSVTYPLPKHSPEEGYLQIHTVVL